MSPPRFIPSTMKAQPELNFVSRNSLHLHGLRPSTGLGKCQNLLLVYVQVNGLSQNLLVKIYDVLLDFCIPVTLYIVMALLMSTFNVHVCFMEKLKKKLHVSG